MCLHGHARGAAETVQRRGRRPLLGQRPASPQAAARPHGLLQAAHRRSGALGPRSRPVPTPRFLQLLAPTSGSVWGGMRAGVTVRGASSHQSAAVWSPFCRCMREGGKERRRPTKGRTRQPGFATASIPCKRVWRERRRTASPLFRKTRSLRSRRLRSFLNTRRTSFYGKGVTLRTSESPLL